MTANAIKNLFLNEDIKHKLNNLEAFDLSSITNRFTDDDHQPTIQGQSIVLKYNNNTDR